MNPTFWALFSGRLPALLVVATTTVMMAVAFYMEHAMDLEPCPLCMMQRVWVCAAGILAMVALIHGPSGRGRRIWAGVIAAAALIGAWFSGRQIWLQHLPADEVPACGPGLGYMIEVFPWTEVLSAMMNGTGDCAEVVWQFLGLSIPAWTLLGFLFLADLMLLWFLAAGKVPAGTGHRSNNTAET